MSAKILLLDIETAPNVVYTWGVFEQNAIKIIRPWFMLGFSYKWLGEKDVYVCALPDYDGYKRDPYNDGELVKDLWKLLDTADIVVAHNGDAFDIKKSNARFAKHGLSPPSTYKTVDTLKIAKKHFKFDMNNLNALSEFFDLGGKVSTGGFALWEGCINGDPQSWKTMKDYNAHDVLLLEKIYLKLRSWSPSHPNVAIYDKTEHLCPTCGSGDVQRRGFNYAKVQVRQRYHCRSCGSWYSGKIIKKSEMK